MDFAYWLGIGLTLGPILAGVGVVFEKVRQIEKRLDANGVGVPGRCKVHEERLNNHDRRILAMEESE